eukprot:1820577-Rhodomonas_salina.1
MLLRARYAMPGTDIAHTFSLREARYWDTVCVHARYAMSGTEIAYACTLAMRWPCMVPQTRRQRQGTIPAFVLRLCYAMSGTDRAYAPPPFAMRYPIRT